VAARESGGPFRSLADFCSRIDLRLANRKVLESLARVGALNAFGHPAQILLGLDDALAAGQASQRDRVTGQTSLFDMGADEGQVLERPLPVTPETPVRERLRWEKELLGLYLSAHPMGEVAEQVVGYVNAYSGDLKDETLDGQRVVVGGIVTGVRSVITRSKSTMAVATLEDLQGTIEVVVFPKTYEQTAGIWREGSILLVAGRVDHRGEEASILADSVWDWDEAAARGPEAFAREVGQLDRRRRSGPPGGSGGAGREGGGRNGFDRRQAPAPAAAIGIAVGPGAAPGPAMPPSGNVTPLRAPDGSLDVPVRGSDGASLPPLAPGEPVPTYVEPPGASALHADEHEEPPLPDEARARAVTAAQEPSRPLEASPGQVLHVRFARGAGQDRVVSAMQSFRALLRERPGSTRVVVHVPAPGGSALPMELRGVAYDTELLAEVRRRLGEGVVELALQ
ncbi:MAG TPA: OB-fold nucleic acid binding domain-containing protein, partial [Candidatus Limnocylindrales bacterium]|nr:OB-fold nucleic acid binding domain-containing protein [Candidatus Limnocylindrales bacterium]